MEFEFTLARKLGMTRKELLQRIDAEEFMYWQKYAAKRVSAAERAAALKKEIKEVW